MPDDITVRIANFIKPFRVTPGSRVTLATDFDPGFKASIAKKKDGVGRLNDGIELLSEYQQRLAAESARGVIGIFNRSHYEEVLVVRVHRRSSAERGCPRTITSGSTATARSTNGSGA